MANYATLKSAIQQVVKTNGNEEITGALLQQTLLAIVNSFSAGYMFMGVATPNTNPGTPDQKVFYVATDGVFPNFGGIEIDKGDIGFLKWDAEWSLDTIAGIGTNVFQVANVAENGLYFVDSSMNVGAQLTQDGFNSFNSLNFRTL